MDTTFAHSILFLGKLEHLKMQISDLIKICIFLMSPYQRTSDFLTFEQIPFEQNSGHHRVRLP